MLNKILFAAGVCLLASGIASATVLNVDFNVTGGTSGTYDALGAAPDSVSNTFWNGVNIGTTGPFTSGVNALKYSDNATVATGVSFTLGHYNAFDTLTTFGFSTSFANKLFGDLAYDSDNSNTLPSGTFAINGLPATAVCNLYLYSMTGYPNSDNTAFTVDGVVGSTLVTGLPSAYSSFDDATGDTTGNYVVYSGLSPTANTISGTFSGSNGRFNGFQLEVFLPEPSSAALIGIAFVGLSARARRR